MRIVAGFGCRPGASPTALLDALTATGGGASVTALATIAARRPELAALAAQLDLPLQIVGVAGIDTPTKSPRILTLHQTGSVAEAAALAAAGPAARLLSPRAVSVCGRATAALATPDPTEVP